MDNTGLWTEKRVDQKKKLVTPLYFVKLKDRMVLIAHPERSGH
jgi:hypothetical protein